MSADFRKVCLQDFPENSESIYACCFSDQTFQHNLCFSNDEVILVTVLLLLHFVYRSDLLGYVCFPFLNSLLILFSEYPAKHDNEY